MGRTMLSFIGESSLTAQTILCKKRQRGGRSYATGKGGLKLFCEPRPAPSHSVSQSVPGCNSDRKQVHSLIENALMLSISPLL